MIDPGLALIIVALINVVGVIISVGNRNRLDRVEKHTNGMSRRLEAAAYKEGVADEQSATDKDQKSGR